MNKYRLLILLSLIVIVPIGFLTKFYTGPTQNWVNDSLGGLFYEIFWCLVFGFLLPDTNPLKIAIWVVVATCLLEFLQLYHWPILEIIRNNFIGRTILGNSFNWKDFPYYIFGSVIGYFWLIASRKLSVAN